MHERSRDVRDRRSRSPSFQTKIRASGKQRFSDSEIERRPRGMNEPLPCRTRTIELDYDEVEVGKTVVRTIEVWNESCKEQTYQAQRDPTTNPLDHVFHLRSYTWTLSPDEKFTCEIRYRPFVASFKNVDYFHVTDTSGACLKITTRGSGIGPDVTCSKTKIFMCCTNEIPEVKRRIKLTNNSKVAATFMCSIDDKYKPFKLDSGYGLINPCSYKYITITFAPPKHGRYTYHLPVLVLHQEPIIIHLYGYYGASSKKEDTNQFSYLWKDKSGFSGYMNGSGDTIEDLPPVSLSRNDFDFGRADVDTENFVQRIPHAICLTNHGQTNLLVAWEEAIAKQTVHCAKIMEPFVTEAALNPVIFFDIDGIFNVTPCEMQVKANQSALFELSFNPSVKNNLFGREIVGSVSMDQKIQLTFPFVTSVRAIGHSFPIGSNGWIPQYEIPQTVIMPPCVPPFPVYTTFLIKKFGHLPLVFQFVPPPGNHFTVKPMLGIIYQSYQIIVVEMTPNLKDEQIYIERWSIYFNGNTKNESYIDFKGYAEYANVIFCKNNVLNFAPVFPQCQQFEQLGMRNITRHRIKYQFPKLPHELGMEYPSAEIDPNDILFQECSLCPTGPNINYDFELPCILVVVKNGNIIGSECSINLRVQGRSETGSLMAMPKELNFGELEYSNHKTLNFVLFNFSTINIYYQLICNHRNWPLGNIQNDVKLHPASGTVFSGSHVKIMVSITPRTRGYYEFVIQYLIRINFRSDVLISVQSPTRICTVSCMCILPTLKVRNLCAYAYNHRHSINISKTFLWTSMHINKLNAILENIIPEERYTLNIDFFPMIRNQGAVVIKLIVANPSRMPVSWIFKRVCQCSCKPVTKKANRSLQVNDCVHESLCTLSPTSGTLKPNQEAIISLKVYYVLVEKSNISWHLDIGHDRRVTLNMLIECMSECEQQHNFLSSTRVKFGRVYFGNKQAIYKARWMCNVTNEDLPFVVDVNPVCKLNEAYHCEVFSCLTTSGVLKAKASTPLLLKFQPRMFGAYKVMLPVTLGGQETELTLEGESCYNLRLPIIGKPIPAHCVCKTAAFPIYFNMDCIDVWSIPTYNSNIKMLLMYNNLSYAALAYEWKCQEVPDIIRVEVFPHKGIMRPNAVQSFKVKIHSMGTSCRIDVNVPCKFFNASQRRDYERSVIKHNILSEELKGQFVITEKGTHVPKPWIKILDKPDVYSKMLCLRCYIYPVEDECLRVSLAEELKTAPANAVYFEKSEHSNVVKEEELSIVSFILEGLLWDILHSRRLKEIIEDTLVEERNLYYSQFIMDISERKKLVQRSYISPPLTLINSILEEVLFITVHEEFSLETAHLIPDEDVRHSNYLKTLPKRNRITIHQEQHTVDDHKGAVISTYVKRGSRVSFAN